MAHNLDSSARFGGHDQQTGLLGEELKNSDKLERNTVNAASCETLEDQETKIQTKYNSFTHNKVLETRSLSSKSKG